MAEWCAGLLSGAIRHDDPARPSLAWLGGAHATILLRDRGGDLGVQAYWPRVWAARGLLHVWNPVATATILAALDDPEWRVREMAAKVVRRWELGEAAERLAGMADDPVPRVRLAVVRALERVGDAEALDAVDQLSADTDPKVAGAARLAAGRLRRRIDA